MTNFEYHEDKILQIIRDNKKIGLYNSEPVHCNIMGCYGCDLKGVDCEIGLLNWLYQEYEPHTDWSKVEVDTPILVSAKKEKWYRRYFAKYEDGKVYAFQCGATSWTNETEPVSWNYAKLKEEE